ncbi:uncharacterized protein LOC143024373 [Oratosquilla oratoria]|uniref:uncharacterized protein LOC143024373 n=1 Tax=Oratosquilla oratoria TaxID=337810 RepID=UPI003F75B479
MAMSKPLGQMFCHSSGVIHGRHITGTFSGCKCNVMCRPKDEDPRICLNPALRKLLFKDSRHGHPTCLCLRISTLLCHLVSVIQELIRAESKSRLMKTIFAPEVKHQLKPGNRLVRVGSCRRPPH